MKTNLISLTIISISLFLISCNVYENDVVPSSNVTSTQATFSGYDAIDASSAFTVYLDFSDADESIEIEANDNLHQHIEVSKVGGTLKIGIENNVHIRGNATLNVYITTKSVSSFLGSGATRFIVEDMINESDVMINLSGASTFTGELNANNLYADLSGASVMHVTGFVENSDIEASGASLIKDYGLETDHLNAELSGASNVSLTINEDIDIEASGASILKYKGNAVIANQDLSGASSVQKM